MFIDNRQQQRSLTNAMFNAQMNNPQLIALLVKLAPALFNMPFDQLSEDTKGFMRLVTGAVNNSFVSDMVGIDNGGSQLEYINRGVAASPIPMYAAGGPGAGRSMGYSYGSGNVSTSVATQILSSLRESMYDPSGATNYNFTRGLSGNSMAQIAGKVLANRGIRDGEVEAVDLSGSHAELYAKATGLRGKVDAETWTKLHKVTEAKRDQEVLMRDSNLTQEQALEQLRKEDKYDSETMDNLKLQNNGSLRGTFLNKKVADDVKEGTRKFAESIKILEEITGYTDLEDLQGVADSARLGSLTSERDIKQVRDSLQNMRTMATMQNRDIKEVFKERQDVVQALAVGYEGTQYVPGAAAEAVQTVGVQAAINYENGSSLITREEAMAREISTQTMASEFHSDLAVFKKAVQENWNSMSPEQQAKAAALEKQYMDAYTSGQDPSSYAVAMSEMSLSLDSRASSDEYKRAAVGQFAEDVGRMSADANLNENTKIITERLRDNRNIGFEAASRYGVDEEQFASTMAAMNRAYGTDSNAMQGHTERMSAIVEEIHQKPDQKDAILARERKSIESMSPEMQAYMETSLQFASQFSDADSYRTAATAMQREILHDPTMIKTGQATKEAQQTVAYNNILNDIKAGDEMYEGSGLKAFTAGLFGDAETGPGATVHALLSQEDTSSTPEALDAALAKYKGGTIGEFDSQGNLKLEEPHLATLLSRNPNLAAELGIEDPDKYIADNGGEQAAMTAMLKDLRAKGVVSKYGNKLVFMNHAKADAKMAEYKKAMGTDDAKNLAKLFGKENMRVKGEGDDMTAYVKDGDGDRDITKFDEAAKAAAVGMVLDTDDKYDEMRSRVGKMAAAGDETALSIQHELIKTATGTEQNADAAREYLSTNYGVEDLSVFSSKEKAIAAGIQFDEDGKVVNGGEKVKGKTLEDIQTNLKNSYDDEMSEMIGGSSKAGGELGSIAAMIEKMLTEGLGVFIK